MTSLINYLYSVIINVIHSALDTMGSIQSKLGLAPPAAASVPAPVPDPSIAPLGHEFCYFALLEFPPDAATGLLRRHPACAACLRARHTKLPPPPPPQRVVEERPRRRVRKMVVEQVAYYQLGHEPCYFLLHEWNGSSAKELGVCDECFLSWSNARAEVGEKPA